MDATATRRHGRRRRWRRQNEEHQSSGAACWQSEPPRRNEIAPHQGPSPQPAQAVGVSAILGRVVVLAALVGVVYVGMGQYL
ncbi:hypothetical protein GN316_03120 [Xylophilus sp. Kf1]|nr:hypothetical protein [Xylophilus sp. Kf1]